MNQTPKNILMIGHDGSLTGAPVLMLNLAKLLKEKYRLTIVLKRGGVLEGRYREVADTYILKGTSYSRPGGIVQKTLSRIGYFFRLLKMIPLFAKADLIFSNTISNGRLLRIFRFFNKPVLVYVHELESVIRYFDQTRDATLSLRYAHLLLYPSRAVQDNLVRNHGIDAAKTRWLPYYFPQADFSFTASAIEEARGRFRQQWNIPGDAKLVAGMGVVSARKGTDRFVEVARQAIASDDRVYFTWIGDFDDSGLSRQIKTAYEEGRYPRQLIFTGPMAYAPTNLQPFDLFFLSSVEDPYPLVVLEAAYQGVPSVCFANSGGITEFAGEGAGYILADGGAADTAASLVTILQDRERRDAVAAAAREKVTKLHSDPEGLLGIFDTIIHQFKNRI